MMIVDLQGKLGAFINASSKMIREEKYTERILCQYWLPTATSVFGDVAAQIITI